MADVVLFLHLHLIKALVVRDVPPPPLRICMLWYCKVISGGFIAPQAAVWEQQGEEPSLLQASAPGSHPWVQLWACLPEGGLGMIRLDH